MSFKNATSSSAEKKKNALSIENGTLFCVDLLFCTQIGLSGAI